MKTRLADFRPRPSSVYGGSQQMQTHYGDEGGYALKYSRRISPEAFSGSSPDLMR